MIQEKELGVNTDLRKNFVEFFSSEVSFCDQIKQFCDDFEGNYKDLPQYKRQKAFLEETLQAYRTLQENPYKDIYLYDVETEKYLFLCEEELKSEEELTEKDIVMKRDDR